MGMSMLSALRPLSVCCLACIPQEPVALAPSTEPMWGRRTYIAEQIGMVVCMCLCMRLLKSSTEAGITNQGETWLRCLNGLFHT